MPVYQFECLTCGHRFDELMRLSDPNPEHCPCERAQPVRRALTAPNFRLAGSGWYETDFKKDGDVKRNLAGDSPPGNSAPGGDKGDSAKGDGAKGDSAKGADSGAGASAAAGKTDPSAKPPAPNTSPASTPTSSSAPKPAGGD